MVNTLTFFSLLSFSRCVVSSRKTSNAFIVVMNKPLKDRIGSFFIRRYPKAH